MYNFKRLCVTTNNGQKIAASVTVPCNQTNILKYKVSSKYKYIYETTIRPIMTLTTSITQKGEYSGPIKKRTNNQIKN